MSLADSLFQLTPAPGLLLLIIAAIALVESLALVGLLVPGVVLMAAASSLAGHQDLAIAPVLGAAFLGAVAGDGLSFLLGYTQRERVTALWPLSRHPEWLARGARFFQRHGTLSVFLGRFVGPVRPVVPLIAGMLQMSPRTFTWANLGSALLWLTGIAVVGTVGFVWNGLFNFYVSYLVAGKGLPPGTARTLLTLVFAAGLPAFLLTGRLADRVPNVPLVLVVVGGFVVTVYALTLATGLLTIVVVSVLLGYVVHSMFPVVDTYLLTSLPDHHRASAYTFYSAAMMVAQAPGSLAVGSLVGRGLAYDAVFAWFAGGLAVVLVGLVGLHLTGHIPAGRVRGTPAGEY